jgi:uncharacterized protein (TIGR02270 family)
MTTRTRLEKSRPFRQEINPKVVAKHAEDAAFLWGQRDAAVRAPHYALKDLVKLEERLEAHLDGLRVAGELGWEMIKPPIEEGAPGAVFAAGVRAFEAGDQARIQELLPFGTAKPEAARGFISALGWLPYEQVARQIKPLVSTAESALKYVGIAALAIHRRNPGPALTEALAAADPLLKARALRAAGELGLVDLQVSLRAHRTRAKDAACRFWAAWSSALLTGHEDAVAYLRNLAEAGGPLSEQAVTMAMRRLSSHDAKVWIKKLIKELGRSRIAAVGAGALADPEIIPWLIEQMKVPKLARVAGESFSLSTGARIAFEDLDAEQPGDPSVGPAGDPEDEKRALEQDLSLPWPDPALVKKWWEVHRGNFSNGTRYLLGRPIEAEAIRLALKTGYQRQRAAAAIELAILNPGRPLFEVRAPGLRQQKLLG